MKTRTILSLFALIGICDAAAISEPQIEELKDANVADNIVKSDGAKPPAPFPLYNSKLLGFLKFFNPPIYGSSSVQIDDRIIDDYETVELATALIAYDQKLSAAKNCIKFNEIIVSAIRLRSLVPDYVVDFDSIREYRSKRNCLDGKITFEIVPSRQLLINSINLVSGPLIDYWPISETAFREIFKFDFNGPKSIDELAAEKDAETSEKTAESFEIFSKIQQILQLKSPISSEKFSTTLLNSISPNLIFMSGFLNSMQKYQVEAQSSHQSKMKALKNWLRLYYGLNEYLQEVVNSLQESQWQKEFISFP